MNVMAGAEMPIDKAVAAGLAVQAAYAVTTGNDPVYSPPAGYEIVTAFFGNDLATDVSTAAGRLVDYLPYGFVAKSIGGNDFIVAIRGTQNILEWAQDARFLKEPFTFVANAGNTEDGFTDVYASMKIAPDQTGPRLVESLRTILAASPGATLTISGHSLGSALATLLAIDVVGNGVHASPAVYTFASPYVGDSVFAQRFDALVTNSWRIANMVDIVTHLPLSVLEGYEHVNSVHQMNFLGEVRTDVICFHALNSYLHFVAEQDSALAQVQLDSGCKPGLTL